MGITTSKSFALLMNVLLIFDMHEVKVVFFLKVNFCYLFCFLSLLHVIVIISLTSIYVSLYSHKPGLSTGVLKLMF